MRHRWYKCKFCWELLTFTISWLLLLAGIFHMAVSSLNHPAPKPAPGRVEIFSTGLGWPVPYWVPVKK